MATTRRARASKRGGTRRGGGWKSFFGLKKKSNKPKNNKPKNNKPSFWGNMKYAMRNPVNNRPPTKEERNAENKAVRELAAEWRKEGKNKTVRWMKSANRKIESLLSKGKNAFTTKAENNIDENVDKHVKNVESALKNYRGATTRKNAVNAWEKAGKAHNALSGRPDLKKVADFLWKDMKKAKCVNTKTAKWRNGVLPDCKGYGDYKNEYTAAEAALKTAEKALTNAETAKNPTEAAANAETAARALAAATTTPTASNAAWEGPSFYEILGVPENADKATILKGYIKAARQGEYRHPKNGGDPEKFKVLKEIYEVLSNPLKKFSYNTSLAGHKVNRLYAETRAPK